MVKPHADAQNGSRLFSSLRFSRTALRNSLLLVVVACAASLVLYLSPKASAVNRTWAGGGATNNWSEAADWSDDTVPGSGDLAVFDGSGPNGNKNATIDTTLNLGGIQITSGYTGTITQSPGVNVTLAGEAPSSSSYVQAGGTFNGGSGTITLNSHFRLSAGTFNASSGTITIGGLFTQSGGAFNASSSPLTFNHNFTVSGGAFNGRGNIDVNGGQFGTGYTLSGGTFNAPPGTMSFDGTFIHSAGGTFNHNKEP